MVADADLPVWSFQPTWANGVRETLGWQTDIIGTIFEQRRSIRLTPRRSFEFDLIATDESRTLLTLLLHRMGADEFMFPLWIDGVRLDGLGAGSDRIDFPTAYMEYAAGLAIVIGDSPFNYEVVEIISVDANGVDLAAPTGGAFPAGCRVYPMLRGRLDESQQVQRALQRVGQATLRFNVTKANPRTVEAEVGTLYRGDPVLEAWPDERETLDYQFTRSSYSVDSGYGLPHVVDEGGRAFTAEAYGWFLSTKQRQSEFRDMLYRTRGRAKARWIPSFAKDARLALAAASGAVNIRVKECGLTYVGGPYSGRQDIRVEMTSGTVFYRRITAAGLAITGQEQWTLDTGVPVALTPETVKRITFMDMGRLDNDQIEINHLTNTVATAKAAFRTVKTGRTAPLPIELPIPTAEMGGPCGDVETCSPAPEWESGFWGRFDVRTNLGPNFPVIGPWAWQFQLWLGDENQGGTIISADNYSDYDGGGPDPWTLPYDYLLGWTTYYMTPDLAALRGEAGWATDPFASGMPDKLVIPVIQWPYNDYIFPGGSTFGDGQGTMSIVFHRVNGGTVDFGTISIFGLWPASYTLFPV